MDCEWVELLLVDHLDGACIDPLREKIDRHLAGCAACRAERDAMAGVDGALAGVVVPDPPDALADDVLRGALRPVAPALRRRDVRALAAAATLLASVSGLYSLFGDSVRAIVPDPRAVTELAESAARRGESIAGTVLEFARETLGLSGAAAP